LPSAGLAAAHAIVLFALAPAISLHPPAVADAFPGAYCCLDLIVRLLISAVAGFVASPAAFYRLNPMVQLPIAAAAVFAAVVAATFAAIPAACLCSYSTGQLPIAAAVAFPVACYCLNLMARLHFDDDQLLDQCPS
jgi:hypothetical protein